MAGAALADQRGFLLASCLDGDLRFAEAGARAGDCFAAGVPRFSGFADLAAGFSAGLAAPFSVFFVGCAAGFSSGGADFALTLPLPDLD